MRWGDFYERLHEKRRQDIIDFLKANLGATVNRISIELGLSQHPVEKIVDTLERQRTVKKEKQSGGRYMRYTYTIIGTGASL